MRGFPQPNRLVRVPPTKRGLAFTLRVTAVLSVASIPLMAALGAWCLASMGDHEPPWLRTAWKVSFIGFCIALPTSIVTLWAAKRFSALWSDHVVPVRVVVNEDLMPKPTVAAGTYVARELVFSLAGAASALSTISQGRALEYPWVEYEFIRDYQLRTGRAQLERGTVWDVQPGDVIWLVPRGWLRDAVAWSPTKGHAKPACKADPLVAQWFEQASARALRVAKRRKRHSRLLLSLRSARKRRAKYEKKA